MSGVVVEIALPRRDPWPRRWRLLAAAAFVALMATAWSAAEIRPVDLVRDIGNAGKLARDFLPPDAHDWRFYAQEMWITLAIALWGTFLAAAAAVPLGLLASANVAPWWIRQPVRRLLDCARAINEMVFALLLVVVVGLGPFAGVLALAIHTTGIFGKLFSEAVENIDPRPVEGIRATGAGRLEEVAYGVLPQVLPLWVSYVLYRFESNVRSATVVGMVGGGGIGVVVWDCIRGFEYPKASAILVVLVMTVMVIDVISSQARKLLL